MHAGPANPPPSRFTHPPPPLAMHPPMAPMPQPPLVLPLPPLPPLAPPPLATAPAPTPILAPVTPAPPTLPAFLGNSPSPVECMSMPHLTLWQRRSCVASNLRLGLSGLWLGQLGREAGQPKILVHNTFAGSGNLVVHERRLLRQGGLYALFKPVDLASRIFVKSAFIRANLMHHLCCLHASTFQAFVWLVQPMQPYFSEID